MNLDMFPALTVIAIFFVLGILIENFINIPFFILLPLVILFIVLAWLLYKSEKFYCIFFFLAVLFLGALHLQVWQRLPANHISRFNSQAELISIRGVVQSDPILSKKKTSFIFETREVLIRGRRLYVRGVVLVNTFTTNKFGYGQELSLEGNLHSPYNFPISEHIFYRDYLKNKNIHSILEVKQSNKILLLLENKGNPLLRFAYHLKNKLHNNITFYFSENNGVILHKMLLGSGVSVAGPARDAFVKTNTAHILAISGLHIGIIAFIVLVLLKALRIKRKLRYFLAIVFLGFYCLLTGASASSLRATLMASVLFIGYLLDREANIYNCLALAALIILILNPRQLFDIGFQLSFVSVLSIVMFSPWLRRIILPQNISLKPLNYLASAFLVSLSAWIGTLGFIVYYFNIISPVAVLANLVIVPYMSIVIALGFAFSIFSLILPRLAGVIAPACDLSLTLLVLIADSLSRLPFAYFYIHRA